MKRIVYILCSLLFLAIILLYPVQSFEGAKLGLNLWFYTIIPTLLPFIILSNLMIQLNATDSLSIIISPLTKKTLKISKAGNYAIIIGMLCGYPMGAKAVNDLVVHKKISKTEGQYLLSFCNNVSPMFIISFIVHTTLRTPELLSKILLILYGAPLCCAILFNFFYRKKSNNLMELPNQKKVIVKSIDFNLVDSCIIKSFETITKLGGYIILFSIISTFFVYFLNTNAYIKSSIIGLFEITTGINYIGTTYISQNAKIIIICMITAFGGFSSIAQTQSILKESELSVSLYFLCKIITAIIAFCFAYLLL